MEINDKLDFKALYLKFYSPVTDLDCGKKCAPHNENGVPFCCDTTHIVPTSYDEEWHYLRSNTNLWHLWESNDPDIDYDLRNGTPDGQVLIECLGHNQCQREFRSISCRTFPFAPYVSSDGTFIGLTYYWQYVDLCWVISNLDQVKREFQEEFLKIYDKLFEVYPDEKLEYQYHSDLMRQVYTKRKRAIPIFHRNGNTYKIYPKTGRKRKVEAQNFKKFGPYKIAADMPFPDEIPDAD